MKNVLKLTLIAFTMAIGFTACSDDDDLPQVSTNITYSGATMVDGTLYVVQTDTFRINSVTATPMRKGKQASITYVTYGADGWVVGVTNTAPFTVTFNPETLAIGKHLFTMTMGIIETGCTPATGYHAMQMLVVANSADIPTPGSNDEQGMIRGTPSIQ